MRKNSKFIFICKMIKSCSFKWIANVKLPNSWKIGKRFL